MRITDCFYAPDGERFESEMDWLVMSLMEQTFHQTDETAKVIVDEFVKKYPKILEENDIEYLYII